MNSELEQKLANDFPKLFAGCKKSIQESLMPFGCECGDGWYEIIRQMCIEIENRCKNKKIENFEFSQIKEKFASLRVYYDGQYDEHINGIIDMAEAISSVTCEICGARGFRHKNGGWMRTLCHKDAKELQYEPCKPD